jgi:hypothetical protein
MEDDEFIETDQQVGEAQEKRKSRLLRKSLGYTRGGWKA